MKKAAPTKLRIIVSIARAGSSGRDYYSGILRYAEKKLNWQVISPGTRYLDESCEQVIKDSIDNPIDGLITDLDSSSITPENIRFRTRKNYVVSDFIGKRAHPATCSVDDAQIGRTAAELLLRHGYNEFAYVAVLDSANNGSQHSLRRQRAFADTIRQAGFTVHIVPLDKNLRSNLRSLPKPIGVLAYNDALARDVMDVCRIEHIVVPEQLSIIGVDNDSTLCENIRPTISTIQPNFEYGGYLAAEILDQLLNGCKRKLHLTYGIKSVIERESSRSLKQGWRTVNAAMRIITERYPEKLTTTLIANELKICATLLRTRFAEVTNQSVHETLTQVRLKAAEKLLASANETVQEIAAKCGFPCIENFIRRFKQHYQLTPKEYQLKLSRPFPCGKTAQARTREPTRQ